MDCLDRLDLLDGCRWDGDYGYCTVLYCAVLHCIGCYDCGRELCLIDRSYTEGGGGGGERLGKRWGS
jgi:hypothetical protein